jgi:urease accessory protein
VTSSLLLLLLDSRSPAGAHGHSGGMESAVTAGFVSGVPDVEEFCRFRLRTSGQAAAAFAAVACQLWLSGSGPAPGGSASLGGAAPPGHSAPRGEGAPRGDSALWAELDAEFSARVSSAAARAASRQLGNGLRRLVRAMVPSADLAAPWQRIERPAPHHPLVLGAAVAIAGGDPQLAGLAAALGTCTGPGSAAVRLLGLDPYAVQGVLAGLSAEIDATGAAGARFALGNGRAPEFRELPALAAPALELLADVHARSEVRLFAS